MPELDPVIHAKSRLRALTTLNEAGERNRIAFTKLRAMLDMTAGNLSTHLCNLEDAGYIEVTKTIEGRSPATYGHQRGRETRLRAVPQGTQGSAHGSGARGRAPAPRRRTAAALTVVPSNPFPEAA